jgi:hypothetical protein
MVARALGHLYIQQSSVSKSYKFPVSPLLISSVFYWSLTMECSYPSVAWAHLCGGEGEYQALLFVHLGIQPLLLFHQ